MENHWNVDKWPLKKKKQTLKFGEHNTINQSLVDEGKALNTEGNCFDIYYAIPSQTWFSIQDSSLSVFDGPQIRKRCLEFVSDCSSKHFWGNKRAMSYTDLDKTVLKDLEELGWASKFTFCKHLDNVSSRLGAVR